MSVASILARGRAAALARMTDACVIERLTKGAFNSTTGEYPDAWTEIYSGRCRIKSQGGGSDTQFAEHEVVLHGYQVKLPWDMEPEVIPKDRVTMTVCEDAWVLGRHLEVTGIPLDGNTTERRVTVQDRS